MQLLEVLAQYGYNEGNYIAAEAEFYASQESHVDDMVKDHHGNLEDDTMAAALYYLEKALEKDHPEIVKELINKYNEGLIDRIKREMFLFELNNPQID